ncbi:Putative ribonuclease H protein At1g65750 [Linum perenne]
MTWERTCVHKEAGGMGFRDLRSFNLAIIFKARYFPRGDFLSTPKGNGPSYVWKSIRRSQLVIHRGPRWRGLKVCDLLIPGLLEWDQEIIESLFEQRDAKEIVSVPLGIGGLADKLIWHYDQKGNYSVRSAYRVLTNFMYLRADLDVVGAWSQVWSFQTPPRIKTFVWRLARSVLPSRAVLRGRHIAVLAACGVCASGSEDYNHLFFYCHFAEDCWLDAGLVNKVNDFWRASFDARLQSFLCYPVEEVRTKVATVLWGLWKERNRRVWSNEACTARTATHLALDDVANWIAAQP